MASTRRSRSWLALALVTGLSMLVIVSSTINERLWVPVTPAAALPDTDTSLPATPPGPIYEIVSAAIAAETGEEPRLSTHGGTSDGRFLIALCPVVDFGLPNATMHKLDEAAAMEDIRALQRIYARAIRAALGVSEG